MSSSFDDGSSTRAAVSQALQILAVPTVLMTVSSAPLSFSVAILDGCCSEFLNVAWWRFSMDIAWCSDVVANEARTL